MLTLADVSNAKIVDLLRRYGIDLCVQANGASIPGSFWGEPEAGIVGCAVYARSDTPIHSLLHEASHLICMDDKRRQDVHRDAGGDDLEEAAVCYLQIALAAELDEVGAAMLMQDMDDWGYSFRLGCTSRWFADDADDARHWLLSRQLIEEGGTPCYRRRGD
ncbi:MAG TPA: hypothetical protein PKK10_04845 [Woeseiaceae bacterium]|nr:hypothetical protein [Woeseiaceae bacterium]